MGKSRSVSAKGNLDKEGERLSRVMPKLSLTSR
jgi:hypothetical protein